MMVGYNSDMILFVPISGFEGDNLIERSANLDWYKGPTLLKAIDQIQTPLDKPLRLPLLNVYESGNGIVAVGCVETGILKSGMYITFGPSGFTTKVKSLEMNEKVVQMALPGGILSSTVKKLSAKDLKHGYVASNSKKDPAKEATSFISQVNIMNNCEGQINTGSVVILDCHTSHDAAVFIEILAKIDQCLMSVVKKGTRRNKDKSIAKKVGDRVTACMCSTLPVIVVQYVSGEALRDEP
ncbi:hypothetical protein FNV43_RR01229 [Rhamnella rubrinervis]|uniref:Elongation factor 1-alpha n=1 Tax=Rhamnella rubrinervis TaxID=2594499 RepID=A0A8K0MT52_9ROSA|nr:hypothetical protein FNV43_RR01229 [Rhamnella rubrinervis]